VTSGERRAGAAVVVGTVATLALSLVFLVPVNNGVAQDAGVHPISGRRIAPVMSHLGADWLDRPEREQEEAPDRAIALLAITPGMTVADVGAGSGYMTVKLARAVGPTGHVYATDVQPEMIARLDARIHAEKLLNVTTVLGTADDPRLPLGTLDLILLVDVYHELAEPQRMLQRLKQALHRDGRLVLLEYRKEDPSIPIRDEHKMSVSEAKVEVEAEGYRLTQALEDLPRQHVLIFVAVSGH
jgi:ubiquinone/menaquinone biosynthesis C-methylase UbiE